MQHWTFETVDLTSVRPPEDWGVAVDDGAVDALADAWRGRTLPLPDYAMPGIDAPRDSRHWFDYAGLSIAVAACLWPPEGEDEWHAEHRGELLNDMPGLFACFSRGLPRGAGGYDLARILAWGDEDWNQFFAGRGTLQLVSLRRHRLEHVVETLLEDWDGSFRNLAEDAGFAADRIVRTLVDRVPGYRDMTPTRAGLLPFNKLAHLCTSLMSKAEDAAVTGLETLPAFPDYMLPRILRHHGVLRYTPRLAHAIDTHTLIEHGGPWECALRWSTMYAVERLRAALADRGNATSAVAIDYALWHAAVLGEERAALGPHHRCLTMAY